MAAWHGAHAWLPANSAPAAQREIASGNARRANNRVSITPLACAGTVIHYEPRRRRRQAENRSVELKFPSRRLTALVAVVAVSSVVTWVYSKRKPPPPLSPENAYVNAAVCTGCHADLTAGYRKTGMGRSFARIRSEDMIESGKPFHHKTSESYFSMLARDGKYYQRRWQIGFDGKETNVDEKQVDFIIGSGNHSRTYLHLTSRKTLQVLPLSWYAEKGGYWEMSPGYDQPDFPGSVRPVHYECMFCHNAYPKIPAQFEHEGSTEMTFAEPLPEGIDCQRCHGPGQQHVQAASTGGTRDQIRASIINPKRLNADREIEVCMQCHLETTSLDLPHSIRRFDRPPFSYQPGQPLGDFSIAFDRAGGMKDRFEIAHGAYRLRQSQCYIQSAGKLRCTTCHDPHNIPRGPAAAAHYNAVCGQCHSAALQRAGLAGPHVAGANCIACHMPKRRTDDVVHVVMTDHFIQRQIPAGDLLAAEAEVIESAATAYRGEVVTYYPTPLADTPENALYAAAAQVRNRRNLEAGLPRLANLLEKFRPAQPGFYAELAQGYRAAGNLSQAIPYFEEAARREPTAFRLVQLGTALMDARQFPQAEAVLRRAVTLDPVDPAAWGTLGWVLWQQDKGPEARTTLERAVAIDPDLPELHNNLASVRWGVGDQAGGEQEFREALRIQPGIAEWRLNLGRVLATRGEVPEARYQFEWAIRLQPNFPEARFDYARLLANLGAVDAARVQLLAAASGADAEIRRQALELLQQLRK